MKYFFLVVLFFSSSALADFSNPQGFDNGEQLLSIGQGVYMLQCSAFGMNEASNGYAQQPFAGSNGWGFVAYDGNAGLWYVRTGEEMLGLGLTGYGSGWSSSITGNLDYTTNYYGYGVAAPFIAPPIDLTFDRGVDYGGVDAAWAHGTTLTSEAKQTRLYNAVLRSESEDDWALSGTDSHISTAAELDAIRQHSRRQEQMLELIVGCFFASAMWKPFMWFVRK